MASKGGSKRQRKGKEVGTSSTEAPTESERFLDHAARDKFNSFALKNIKNGRVVDESSHLSAYGLNIVALLEFQGLDKFLATAFGIYPTLVKEFYANLRHPVDGRGTPDKNRLLSRINGIDISFNEHELAEALEIDEHDDSLNITKFSDIATVDPDCDILEALNVICLEPRSHTSNVRATHLKLSCHIIHRILVQALNPRSGSYDQVPKFDIYLVWAIYTQKRINWAGFIFYLFKNGAKRKDANLVFGIALSKLFYFFNAVDRAELVKLTTDDYFTETTVQRFGYEIINGSWVRKGGAAAQDEPGIHDDDPMDAEANVDTQPQPSGPTPPTNLDLMIAIQEMTARMDRGFQNLKDAFHFYHPEYHFPDDPPAGV